MRPVRLRHTYELLDALGAFQPPDSSLVEPRLASEEDVLTCHIRDYVDATRSLSAGLSTGDPAKYGFSAAGTTQSTVACTMRRCSLRGRLLLPPIELCQER